MAFPENDAYWLDTLKFIQLHIQPEDKLLAPTEFAEKLNGVFDYSSSDNFKAENYQWLIVHKGRVSEINSYLFQQFYQKNPPVFANEVFVVLSQYKLPNVNTVPIHLKALYKQVILLNWLNRFKALLQRLDLIKMLLNPQRTTVNQQPNLNFINKRLLFTSDAVCLNVKTLGYEYARSLRENLKIPNNLLPQKINLKSKACLQTDVESPWFWYWCQQIKTPVIYHRKLWEFAYILQAIYEYDLLIAGKKGLGFGCGEEPLPSLFAAYDIAIVATDIDPTESAAKGWIETNQNMSSIEKIWHSELCSRELFNKNVSLQYVDMNAIPSHLEGKYDFCWSACALEHLGSIKNGLKFIENSLNTLVPGGICIHTTEFNYLEEKETIDNYGTVLFRKCDFEELAERLTAAGHQVAALDFNIGSGVLDRFIDLPPYDSKIHQLGQEAHLKLLIDGFASTSFGIIIRKAA